MGKKKTKVQWSSVDGLHWKYSEQKSLPVDVSGNLEDSEVVTRRNLMQDTYGNRKSTQLTPGNRKPMQGTAGNSQLGPRFERKAVTKHEHFFYDGEDCESEELPDGFTKIRSKNLDILFKNDYYEQRVANTMASSIEFPKLSARNPTEPHLETLKKDQHSEPDISETIEENMESILKTEDTIKPSGWSFDQIDPNTIPEFKPMDPALQTPQGHTSPVYGSSTPCQESPCSCDQTYPAPLRPNLYLYSPSSNTLIPCEEIILPSPVMSPEGPVYSGPTNIYLAYPVQGPEGKGYITQPFNPSSSLGVSSNYSSSMSYDGSNYYPSTPNIGQDSCSSPEPSSPPVFDNYHPTNWINQQQETLTTSLEDNFSIETSTLHGQKYAGHQPAEIAKDIPRTRETASSDFKTENTLSSSPRTYIPGLPPANLASAPRKYKKRNKKKTKAMTSMEYPIAASSESDTQPSVEDTDKCNNSESNESKLSEPKLEDFCPEINTTEIKEIFLTDDLAEHLVNPPTETDDVQVRDIENTSKLSTKSDVSEAKIPTINPMSKIMPKNIEQEYHERQNELLDVVIVNEDVNNDITEIEGNSCKINNVKVEDVSKTAKQNSSPENNEVSLESENHKELKMVEKVDIDVVPSDLENIPNLKSSLTKIKSKKSKRTKNVTVSLKSGIEAEAETNNITLSSNLSAIDVNKSYSAVIKSNLDKRMENKDNLHIQNKVEAVPEIISKSLPIKSQCKEPKAEVKEKLENWNNTLIHDSNTHNWKKTSGKRKQKKMNKHYDESLLLSEIPDLETINPHKIKEKTARVDEESEIVPVSDKNTENPENIEDKVKQKNKKGKLERHASFEEMPNLEVVDNIQKKATVTNDDEIKSVIEDDDTIEQDQKQERKKLRRKKKKYGSEEKEDSNASHKVVICDAEIDIGFMKPLERISGFISSSVLDKFQLAGGGDSLVMTELGSGISRGCMDLGRLYQGKYVPPDRSDGLNTEHEDVEDREDVISEIVAEKDVISKMVTEKDVISEMITEKNVISEMMTEKNMLDSDPTYIDLD